MNSSITYLSKYLQEINVENSVKIEAQVLWWKPNKRTDFHAYKTIYSILLSFDFYRSSTITSRPRQGSSFVSIKMNQAPYLIDSQTSSSGQHGYPAWWQSLPTNVMPFKVNVHS